MEIATAAAENSTYLTMNEAVYRGMLLAFDLLVDPMQRLIIICGDANLVIRQMRGEIDCKAPGVQLLRHKAMLKIHRGRSTNTYI